MGIRVGVIRGNGIGPEITQATLRVLEATDIEFEWVPVAIGDEGVEQYGHPLPQESVKLLKELKLAIKAPLLVDKFKGRLYCEHEDGSVGVYPSLNNAIRRELGLYVCPRPIRGFKGISGAYEDLDVHIMREITEDVYSGIEHMVGDCAAECIKLTTRKAALRVAEYSFDYARKNGRKKVTCVHKANILKISDGLFRDIFYEIREAYPEIAADDKIVDNVCMQMVMNPQQFDVMVMPNLYGDMLSDLASGLIGGLGLLPSSNLGEEFAMFEAVHGSAPDIAGKGIANPTALLWSACMMLEHLGQMECAAKIRRSVDTVLEEGAFNTPDIGGNATTAEYVEEIIKRL